MKITNTYKQADFNNCIINPMQKNLLESNPRLQNLIPVFENPEEEDFDEENEEEMVRVNFFEPEEIECIFRYVIALYDPKSPLFKNERDLYKRKQEAAGIAGIKNDTDYLNSIYDCTHPLVVPLVTGYLRRFAKSMEYAAIVTVENCFWESTQKLLEPISGKNSKEELEAVQKKSAIKDELDKDIERLSRYYKAFFGGDEEIIVKAKSRMTSPEAFGGK